MNTQKIWRWTGIWVVLALLLAPVATAVNAQALSVEARDAVIATALPAWWSATPPPPEVQGLLPDLPSPILLPQPSLKSWKDFLELASPFESTRLALPAPQPSPRAPVAPAAHSRALQADYVYTSTPGLPIISGMCISDVITVTAPGGMLIADLNMGLNVEARLFRGGVTLSLRSPSSTVVNLVQQTPFDYHDNYDVLLDDESANALNDGNADDIGVPYYDRDAAPQGRLATFDGEEAQGPWLLELCFGGPPVPAVLNIWSLWLELRDPAPVYALPYSYKSMSYKIEQGMNGSIILLITNTGELTGTATYVEDALPPELTQSAPATYAVLGSEVSVAGFHDTSPITWLGSIPPGMGVMISVPATVTAMAGAVVTNLLTIADPDAPDTSNIAAVGKVYPEGALYDVRDFNFDDGNLITDTGEWEWGMPSVGPPSCHSQPRCWGTNMDDNFSGPSLLTTTFDLPTRLPTQTLWLQWWEWFDVEETLDAAFVYLISESVPTPTVIYGSGMVYGLTPEQRAHERRWGEVLYDVSPYASETITLYFYLLPVYFAGVNPGWYIDDMGLHLDAAPDFSGSYKVAHTSKLAPGDLLTYTIHITNRGYLTSTHGRMFDPLPDGLSVVAATKVGGGTLTSGANSVTWTTDAGAPLAPGESVTITLVTTVALDTPCGHAFGLEQSAFNTALITDSQAEDAVTIAANPVLVYPELYHLWDFELDEGGFISATGGVWEWGMPALHTGPPSAYSGQNVWGTGLAGPYPSGDPIVLSKTVDLSGVAPATGLSLQWWQWLDIDDDWNDAYVAIASPSSPEPTMLYSWQDSAPTIEQRDPKGTWSHISADITDWAGELVTLSFVLDPGPIGGLWLAGWYIDDVSIHASCPHVTLKPDRQRDWACPGSALNYTLTVRNLTGNPDLIEPMWDGHGWPVSVTPLALSLDVSETGVFTVNVGVPWSAEHLAVNAVEVMAMAMGAGLSDTAMLETLVGPAWMQAAPVPTDVIYHDVVAYNNESYLMGGASSGGGISMITPSRKYSPTVDTWYDLPYEPTPEKYPVLDACQGTNISGDPVIVLFAGAGETDLHVYDIANDTWYTQTSPLPGVDAAQIAYDQENNVCYLIGGEDDTSTITHTLYAYDVAANTGITLPNMTTPRVFHAAWFYNGMVCVGGGANEFPPLAPLGSTQCYSTTGGTWLPENATLGPLPYVTWAMADAEAWVGDVQQLWMMGGIEGYDLLFGTLAALPHAVHWDSDTLTWTWDAPLPEPVFLAASDVQLDDVYVVGGSTSGATSFTPSAFNQRYARCTLPPEWGKWVNTQPWTPGISLTLETSDTFEVVDVVSTSLHFTLTEAWHPMRLALLSHEVSPPSAGTVVTADDRITWTVTGGGPVTLTKLFRVEPSAWTEVFLDERLFVEGSPVPLEKPVQVNKLTPVLEVSSVYTPEVGAGERITFTLTYRNTGGYENAVELRGTFPISVPFETATPPPDDGLPDGTQMLWELGDLANGDHGSIAVTVLVTQSLPVSSTFAIRASIHDHTDAPVDAVTSTFHIAREACVPVTGMDFDWTPASPGTGDSVEFSASPEPPSATALSYDWGFGDGGTASGNPAYHTYLLSDTYTVRLTATNACGGPVYAEHALSITGDIFTPTYGVALTAASDTGSALPGETVRYTLTVKNTGDVADTFDLSTDGSEVWSVSIQPEQLSLPPAGTTPVYVDVHIPAGASGGDSDSVTLIATSQGDPAMTASRALTTTAEEPCVPVTGVDFDWGPLAPGTGDTVAFTATVVPPTATLPIAYAWAFGDGGTASDSPAYHTYLLSGTYTVSVTATNACGGPVSASYALTATGDPFTPTYGVTLSPASDAKSGDAGETVVYTLTMGNTGDAADTLELSTAGGESWATSIAPDQPSLPPGGTRPVQVSVEIPNAANDGDTDTASITAASQGDPSVTASSTLTTTAIVPCEPVTGLTLERVTATPIYTDTLVAFSANIAPDNAGKPYTYTIDYGEGGGPGAPASSSDDPLVLSHTFANTGTYTVEVAVWNCAMTPGQAETDSVQVTVLARGAPGHNIYLPLVLRQHNP